MGSILSAGISTETVVSATKEQVSVTLGDNTVILSMNDGVYYGLNEVGQDIWAMLDRPISVGEICSRIVEMYDVSLPVCERDTCALLQQMAQKRLIVVHDNDAR